MPLPEQITQNPLFMLSLMAPLVPMVVAILILAVRFLKNVSRSMAARREQKRLNVRQKKLARSGKYQGDALELDETMPENIDEFLAAQIAECAPVLGEASESTSQSPGEVSSEIMQLINDVFVDDGKSELNEILLHDTEDISAQELLVLAQDIARQMGIDLSKNAS